MGSVALALYSAYPSWPRCGVCSLRPILSPATDFLTTPLLPACFPLTLEGVSSPLSSAGYPHLSLVCVISLPDTHLPSAEKWFPLSQLGLAQDSYTCVSPYDTGMGRGDEVEGGVVLLIFYTFVRL